MTREELNKFIRDNGICFCSSCKLDSCCCGGCNISFEITDEAWNKISNKKDIIEDLKRKLENGRKRYEAEVIHGENLHEYYKDKMKQLSIAKKALDLACDNLSELDELADSLNGRPGSDCINAKQWKEELLSEAKEIIERGDFKK